MTKMTLIWVIVSLGMLDPVSASYIVGLGNGSYLTSHVQLAYRDDYYAFDTHLPEVKVKAHTVADARLNWQVDDHWSVFTFIKNIGDRAVMTRAVLHSQIVDGLPANPVQASWNDPRTFGLGIKYLH